MEGGFGSPAEQREARARAQRVRRRRVHTLVALAGLALALLCRLCIASKVRAAAAAARAAGEECWPLAGKSLHAVVVLHPSPSPPQLLWRPQYTQDEAPGEVIRAHERSVLCPELRTRIRPKAVNISHLGGSPVLLRDKRAVCVTHYVDFFTTGTC